MRLGVGLTAGIVVLVGSSGAAFGSVLASDDFSYVGALTDNGWTAHSGAGNKVIMSNGDYATLDQSSGSGEDDSLVFAAQGATDTTYAAFDMMVLTADLSSLDSQGLYFAHLKNNSTLFRARTGVVQPTGGGDYGLAINADNSDLGAGVTWASDLAFDAWYRVVISWNAGTGESQLWLNPILETDPSISHTGTFTGDLIEGFALRQSNDYTGFIRIDNVAVGTTFGDVVPTPGALALFGLAGLLGRRRRRA